jgi:signal peptide peptidase SppA
MSFNFWLGNSDSFFELLRDIEVAVEKYGSLNAMRHQIELRSNNDDEEHDFNPVSYDLAGNVAIIGIEGSTIARSSFFSQIFGIPSYEDIKARFIQAHEDPEAKAALMTINTNGGMSDGVFSLSRFIYDFNAKIMPVISYNIAKQLSAGLVYGSAAGQMISDQDASIGSIGAILVHREITEALKMEGIKATVFRSAPYKALGTPYEKLTDVAKEEIQSELMMSHNKFVDTLAHNTGVKVETVHTWATGKVFDAKQALTMGLLDSIQPIENVIAKLNKKLENAPRSAALR